MSEKDNVPSLWDSFNGWMEALDLPPVSSSVPKSIEEIQSNAADDLHSLTVAFAPFTPIK